MLTRQPISLAEYERLRPTLRTGDVIAFAGKGLVSDLIRLATRPNDLGISHVGGVLRTDMDGEDTVLMAESTTLDSDPDLYRGRRIVGVQLHYLSRVLEAYDGHVYLYHLTDPLDDAKALLLQNWVRNRYEEHAGYNYVGVFGEAVQMCFKLNLHLHPTFHKLFCSELWVKALQLCDRVSHELNPDAVTPVGLCALPVFSPPVLLNP